MIAWKMYQDTGELNHQRELLTFQACNGVHIRSRRVGFTHIEVHQARHALEHLSQLAPLQLRERHDVFCRSQDPILTCIQL